LEIPKFEHLEARRATACLREEEVRRLAVPVDDAERVRLPQRIHTWSVIQDGFGKPKRFLRERSDAKSRPRGVSITMYGVPSGRDPRR